MANSMTPTAPDGPPSGAGHQLLEEGWEQDPNRENVWTKDVPTSARERMAASSRNRGGLLLFLLGLFAVAYAAHLASEEAKKK